MLQDARADKLAAEKALIAAQTLLEYLEGSVSTRAMELEQSRCAYASGEAANPSASSPEATLMLYAWAKSISQQMSSAADERHRSRMETPIQGA